MFTKVSIVVMYVLALVLLTGCGSTKPPAESWMLPKKESTDSAMLIGRIDYPVKKKDSTDTNTVYLSEVNFMRKDKVYFGNGEPNFELDNNYFVVPNIKPGKYWMNSFRTGKLFNQLPLYDDKYLVDVKAGQIIFVGSYDLFVYDSSFLGAHSYKFNIKKSDRPTELEMFQWLNRIGMGSGWEPTIRKRIRELGGRL